jgi:hypothetical protein
VAAEIQYAEIHPAAISAEPTSASATRSVAAALVAAVAADRAVVIERRIEHGDVPLVQVQRAARAESPAATAIPSVAALGDEPRDANVLERQAT